MKRRIDSFKGYCLLGADNSAGSTLQALTCFYFLRVVTDCTHGTHILALHTGGATVVDNPFKQTKAGEEGKESAQRTTISAPKPRSNEVEEY